jgi:hypothetical protein
VANWPSNAAQSPSRPRRGVSRQPSNPRRGIFFAQLLAQSSPPNDSPKQDSESERAQQPSCRAEPDEARCLRRYLNHAHRHGREASTTSTAFSAPLRRVSVAALSRGRSSPTTEAARDSSHRNDFVFSDNDRLAVDGIDRCFVHHIVA